MIFKNATIVLEDTIISKGWLQIEGKVIVKISTSECPYEAIDCFGKIIMPGYIDAHIHGGFGYAFEMLNVEGHSHLATKLATEGITSYCLASVSNSDVDNLRFLQTFAQFMQNQNTNSLLGSRCLGLHLEGPFLAPARKGAHQGNLLQVPTIVKMQKFIDVSGNNIKIVTYAPELQNGSFTRFLVDKHIVPSAGHSLIDAETMTQEHLNGINHVTHLFNGMDLLDHKKAGLVTFALVHDNVLCEVIGDLVHLDAMTLRLIYKAKGFRGICLITDGTSATGMPDGHYKLGRLDCCKQGMEMRTLRDGGIAGSVSTYAQNVQNLFKSLAVVPLNHLCHMTSINIARQLGIYDRTGSIAVGKLADIVILNHLLQLEKTIVEGKIIYALEG